MLANLPKRVKVVEVGPRDGLQNEAKQVATADKVRLIEALAGTGLKNIEITSFVSPKAIPQLADGLEVARSLKLPDQIKTSALVPNLKGYEAAKEAQIKEIAIFMSASESHSKSNINKSIAEALSTFEPVVKAAKQDARSVRAYLSVVFECPYEGLIPPEKVLDLCQKLIALGVDELSLGDTIGAANPKSVMKLIDCLSANIAFKKLALHFHDTRGTALVNVLAGLEAGITTYDASIGGMGGCPYAPGASGNLATEDLVYFLNCLGLESGVDIDALVACGSLAQEILGKELPGRYLRAALAKKGKASEEDKGRHLSSQASGIEAQTQIK